MKESKLTKIRFLIFVIFVLALATKGFSSYQVLSEGNIVEAIQFGYGPALQLESSNDQSFRLAAKLLQPWDHSLEDNLFFNCWLGFIATATFFSFFLRGASFLSSLTGSASYSFLALQGQALSPLFYSVLLTPILFALLGDTEELSCEIKSLFDFKSLALFLSIITTGFVWMHLDFGFTLIVLTLFLVGPVLLFKSSCSGALGYPGISALFTVMLLVTDLGRSMWRVLVQLVQNSENILWGIYQFSSPNFHLNSSIPLAFGILVIICSLSVTNLKLVTRVGLIVSLILSLFFTGAGFVFYYFISKAVVEVCQDFESLEVGSVLKWATSFAVAISFFLFVEFEKPEKFKLVSGEAPLLIAIDEVVKKNGKVFNEWQIGSELSSLKIKPFVDERLYTGRGGEDYQDFLELKRIGERADKILDSHDFSYAILFKGSPLFSYLTLKEGWLVLAQGASKERKQLGSTKDRTIVVLRK